MKLSLISPNGDGWSEFISGHPDASVIHNPKWMEFLVSCYGYVPHSLIALDETKQILAYLPLLEVSSWLTGHRVIGLPFSDFCAPILSTNINMSDFIQSLQAWRRERKWPYITIHWPLPVGQEGVYETDRFFRHTTKLAKDPDQVFRNFSKSQVQRSIGLSEKRGVTVRTGKTWEFMDSYYSLHVQTRKRLGVPAQPLRFFRLLWERLISQDLGFILLAYQANQLLAGAVFLHDNKTLTYKFGASDSRFWNLRPNHQIFWRAILWGCENGYDVFDWGRTDIDNPSLCDFKRGWASDEQVLSYTVLSDRPPLSRIGDGFQKNILKGAVQRFPLWFCRLVGELFYVHFA